MTSRHVIHLCAFRDDVRVEVEGDDLLIHHRWGTSAIRDPSPALQAALWRMTLGLVSLDNLADTIITRSEGATEDLARLRWLLRRMQFTLIHALELDDPQQQPLISAVPLSRSAAFHLEPLAEDQPVRLSRFAYLHQRSDFLTIESPLSLHRVLLHQPRAGWVVSALGRAVRPAEIAATLPGSDSGMVEPVLAYLVGAGVAIQGEPSGADGRTSFAEDTDEVLEQWSFHDLLFHSRSRLGRHDDEFGATFPFVGRIEHEPVLKPVPDGPAVPLRRPALDRVLADDLPLTVAVESRRSVRRAGVHPLTAAQLGELLYRTARLRALYSTDEGGSSFYHASDRPYPTGGATHELELYLTVNRCDGLDRAVYYYDPAGHGLVRINDDPQMVASLLQAAARAVGGAEPDVLITITARFQRLSWKYSGLAYAATLKHVGILQQTLYLVATAMELGPCAIGSGDTDLAARAFDLDWLRESSVGDFLLYSRPEDFTPYWPGGIDERFVRAWRPMNDPEWASAVPLDNQPTPTPRPTPAPAPSGGDDHR